MKKTLQLLLLTFLTFAALITTTGCSTNNLQAKSDIKQLKQDLISLTKENTKTYFNKSIDTSNFDISLAEKTSDNTYETITDINTQNEVYLIGHYNGKPKEVINFILLYDMSSKKVISFGIQTTNDKEIVYADIDNN